MVTDEPTMGTIRTIRRWAAAQLGKPAELITTSDILARLPRRAHLRYDKTATKSPLGGRIAPHLRHLEEEEAKELLREGEAFLRDTPTDDESANSDSRSVR
jgi:hypothetical protein